jgi:RecB family exonuclease
VKSYLSSQKIHWSKFFYEDPKTRIALRGTPDDVFRKPDGTHHIVDYKTAKVTKTQDELLPLYLVQLNVYAYIGNMRKEFPTTELSLIYVEPLTEIPSTEFDQVMSDSGFALNFMATRKKVELKPRAWIEELLAKAREIYERSRPPAGRKGCKDCELLEGLMNVAQGSRKK